MIKICQRYAGDIDGAGIIFNNAMMRVFRNIKNYQHEGKLGAWIKAIIINCALDHIKSTGRIKETPITTITEEILIDEYVYEKISAKEIQLTIKELPKATGGLTFLFMKATHKQIGGFRNLRRYLKWHINEGRRLLETKPIIY
jgi:RNA polymerase sigma-70 factor (ECF subfamily)